MVHLNRFYTKEEVTKFLDKFKFIYKIPDLKRDYYEILLTEDKKNILYASQQNYKKYHWNQAGLKFYDKNEMTFIEFGIKKERFFIDKEREKKFMSKKIKWKGQDFREILIKEKDVNLFRKIPIGKNSIMVSIQAGKYFGSIPNTNVEIDSYTHYEIAFFNKNKIIIDKKKIEDLFKNFDRKEELFKKTNDGICFREVNVPLIQDIMIYLKKLPKIYQ